MADKDKDVFQRYLDAGIAFTNMTRAKAEALVEDLIQGGEVQGADAKARVEEILERSRRGRAVFIEQVRKEVGRQLEALGVTSLEDLAHQVADLLERTAETGRRAAKKAAGKKAGGKKAEAKRAGAKKAEAKRAGAKRAAAKKAPAKKAPGKKAPGKKAPAKKAPGKKAPAKRAAAKETAARSTAARSPSTASTA